MQFFFFSSRRRHTRWTGDWSSDVCSSDLLAHYWPYILIFWGVIQLIEISIRALSGGPIPVKIGRASCRERVSILVGAAARKKNAGARGNHPIAAAETLLRSTRSIVSIIVV